MALALRGELNSDEEIVSGECRDVSSFEMLQLLGEGTYGKVRKAKDKRTGEIVALKQMIMQDESYKHEGFPLYAVREIKILNKLRHENIIDLKEVVTSPGHNGQFGNVYMVFKYMDHDLTGLATRFSFSVPQIKCYMKQLLTGLHYCHVNKVLHRDIKSSNLLVNNEGILKIGDFGLARNISANDCHEENARLTSTVASLWYRAPELLLGARDYGTSVDMWSAGCVFAELLSGRCRSIFSGIKSEAEIMSRIVEVCGAPDESNWPGVTKLRYYDTYIKTFEQEEKPDMHISKIFGHCGRDAVELLEKLLTLDPSKRISAAVALDSDYFWNDPLPCDAKSLPRNYESSRELDIRNEHEKRKLQQQQLEQNVQHGLKRQRTPKRCQQVQLHEQKNDDVIDVRKQQLQNGENVAKPQKPGLEKRQEIDAQMQKQQYFKNEEQYVVKRPVKYQQRPQINARNNLDVHEGKQKQQHLQNEEQDVVKKPVKYQQRPQINARNDLDVHEGKQKQQHLQNEEQDVVKKPVKYQQRPQINARNDLDVHEGKLKQQQPMQDEQHVAKREKPVEYQQRRYPPPRAMPPPAHRQPERAEARRQGGYRSPFAARPRQPYGNRFPRPYHNGARRYDQNERYASARDSYVKQERWRH